MWCLCLVPVVKPWRILQQRWITTTLSTSCAVEAEFELAWSALLVVLLPEPGRRSAVGKEATLKAPPRNTVRRWQTRTPTRTQTETHESLKNAHMSSHNLIETLSLPEAFQGIP